MIWQQEHCNAMQLSTTTQSVGWADNVPELAMAISKWLMCEAQRLAAAASLRIVNHHFSESPLQLPFSSEPDKSWHEQGVIGEV